MFAANVRAGAPAQTRSSRSSRLGNMQERFGISSLVMVGDGATDAEARQPGGADLFVGYAPHLANTALSQHVAIPRLMEVVRHAGLVAS